MSKKKNYWTHPMPVYVTRKTAGGDTGGLYLSIWMATLVLMLVWLNIVAWSAYGLYTAFQLVF